MFPEEETPEYRYTKWEEIPDLLINREWLCPNFFDIREAMEQLEELASEIREALFNRLTKIGGHFGPNFGMVEAEIAMHYVF